MNYIELFAGCGGLSLGMQQAGFKLLFANELSPMAAETYSYNLLDEDLQKLAESQSEPLKTLWLNSKYSSLKQRLRENPFEFPAFDEEGFSNFPYSKPDELKGKLVVGSIIELNRLLESNSEIRELISSGFDGSGVDVVSGGPPCQSFSMAGLRNKNCDKNLLPWEFAKFVSYIKPKVVLLENVTGILRAFKGDDGSKFYAWFEVAKTFAAIGYVPICLQVNAKFVGVPQNRPRFIMIAIRRDLFEDLAKAMGGQNLLINNSESFFKLVSNQFVQPEYGSLLCYDITKSAHRDVFEKSFLAPLTKGEIASARQALDDLKFTNPSPASGYVRLLNKTFNGPHSDKKISNHEPRSNSDMVKRRFRIYQVLQKVESKNATKQILDVMKGNKEFVDDECWSAVNKFDFLNYSNQLERFHDKETFELYLLKHQTKKHSQKAILPDSPAPAALSIPDDGCHYDENELRVFSVREMARIQSFPDNFIFRSKVTTGGKMRRFEIPQYTQVGNAVPPFLGLALGKVCNQLLKFEQVNYVPSDTALKTVKGFLSRG